MTRPVSASTASGVSSSTAVAAGMLGCGALMSLRFLGLVVVIAFRMFFKKRPFVASLAIFEVPSLEILHFLRFLQQILAYTAGLPSHWHGLFLTWPPEE